jgi:hypothetical protein
MTIDNQIAVIEPQALDISPEQYQRQLGDAQKKARLLKSIVDEQGLFTEISGRKHLHVEAWKTIAKGYGYDIDIEWTRPLENGGWEARAVVRDKAGQTVGHGEAECGSKGDENWEGRASYQQRSMAQTRAISRAGRNNLDWVVVLAGYNATPFEEMGVATPLSTNPQMLCPEHGLEWFMRGKMKSLAHPIEGESGPRGGKKWCNHEDFLGLLLDRMKGHANQMDPEVRTDLGKRWNSMTPTEQWDTVQQFDVQANDEIALAMSSANWRDGTRETEEGAEEESSYFEDQETVNLETGELIAQ